MNDVLKSGTRYDLMLGKYGTYFYDKQTRDLTNHDVFLLLNNYDVNKLLIEREKRELKQEKEELEKKNKELQKLVYKLKSSERIHSIEIKDLQETIIETNWERCKERETCEACDIEPCEDKERDIDYIDDEK
jgi:hypothetical protein